jgi:hypothetical protein
MSDPKFPAAPCSVNWRPEDAGHALRIYECGGPLVDPATGRVIALAAFRDEFWTRFVTLPAGANPAPTPISNTPTTGRAPRAGGFMQARAAWRATLAQAVAA